MEIQNLLQNINGYKSQQLEAGTEAAARKGSSSRQGATGDRVSLSSEARLRAAAMSGAQESPDVRADRVDELKAQVQSGTYSPNSRKTAAGMVKAELDTWGSDKA